jgi:hypothetical protein
MDAVTGPGARLDVSTPVRLGCGYPGADPASLVRGRTASRRAAGRLHEGTACIVNCHRCTHTNLLGSDIGDSMISSPITIMTSHAPGIPSLLSRR